MGGAGMCFVTPNSSGQALVRPPPTTGTAIYFSAQKRTSSAHPKTAIRLSVFGTMLHTCQTRSKRDDQNPIPSPQSQNARLARTPGRT
jgi:hypothetical protein